MDVLAFIVFAMFAFSEGMGIAESHAWLFRLLSLVLTMVALSYALRAVIDFRATLQATTAYRSSPSR
jgi:hypothetical protein